MTLDEFYAALERTPRKWKLHGDHIRIDFPYELHPRLAEFDMDAPQCPWTYVSITERVATLDAEIGSLHAIFAAADNDSGHDPAIRQRLLAACGLEEAR